DICLSNPERNEPADAKEYLSRVIKAVRSPVMIDTTSPEVAELAARLCPGKSVWNSVNLEHGTAKLEKAAELNRLYGTAVVAGCIDDDPDEGMAVSAERKLEVASAMVRLLTEYGMPPEDILLDALVFPVASGQEKYARAAAETVAAIAGFKKHFPKCRTILGVSNVSFGLPPAARETLNSVFLHRCVKAGLDAAIVNIEKLRRFASLSGREITLAGALLENAGQAAVAEFAALYREKKPAVRGPSGDPARALKTAVLEGDRAPVAAAVAALLDKLTPLEIINGPLSQAMAEVGALFGKGELIVTEVLQSAEVMKGAVTALEPELKKTSAPPRGRLLLATVAGDVHDIGKNLVHMIFASNGFEVLDLGVKTPTETIIRNARSFRPDVIGLSGLLTRSAEAMIGVARDLSAAGIHTPLQVGGAALSEKFVFSKIAPAYSGPVIYCPDAMHGLARALELIKAKTE
ncbi:MAG: dihydropteroate synthase, partial [Elusimicrobiaceae bacterium]|nr:dihydropteroate synthase [Elusimicrobiaceae bacterium]